MRNELRSVRFFDGILSSLLGDFERAPVLFVALHLPAPLVTFGFSLWPTSFENEFLSWIAWTLTEYTIVSLLNFFSEGATTYALRNSDLHGGVTGAEVFARIRERGSLA